MCEQFTVSGHPTITEIAGIMRERDRPALQAVHNQLFMSIKMVRKDQTCELRQDDLAMALLPSDPTLPLPHHLTVPIPQAMATACRMQFHWSSKVRLN